MLNQIGFKATPKIISDDSYFPTIGNAKTKAQTGFADWIQDFYSQLRSDRVSTAFLDQIGLRELSTFSRPLCQVLVGSSRKMNQMNM